MKHRRILFFFFEIFSIPQYLPHGIGGGVSTPRRVLDLGFGKTLFFVEQSHCVQQLFWRLPHHIPDNVDSTPYYKPQIHVRPEDVAKNGSGWDSHNRLSDGGNSYTNTR